MGTLAGHILGYVQEWKNGTYTAAEKKEFAHYFGDSTGVTGVEKTYNDILTGRHGKRSLYKDEKGSIVGRAAFDTRAPSCLLYTSPSPRDKRQSRMPSSA